MNNKFEKQDLDQFTTLNKIELPKPLQILPKILSVLFVLIVLILIFTPWQQTSKGTGYVMANDPNNRAQNINAAINGRINKWFVRDGSKVKAGDKIVEIIDNDPQILERLQAEKDAKKQKSEVAQSAAKTAKINYDRQNDLYQKGLSSRKEFESAKIEYEKLVSTAASAAAEFAESQTKLSRQQNQIIYAPKDGIILKILAGDNATTVKTGDKIATFAPELTDAAVELYVNGNDIPLIYQGRKVRLQFEGWPAIQFSGWPSLSIGTFGGVISAIDSSISENGKFRVIVKKGEQDQWPDERFLRHGARAYGWVLLNQVSLGYELWRQANGFPPAFDQNITKTESTKETK